MKRTTAKTAEKSQDQLSELVNLMRELLGGFTRHTKDLRVTAQRLGLSIGITIQANADDQPRLVGSRGGHIWAIQTIFGFIGRKMDIAIKVTLLEPWTGQRTKMADYIEDPHWSPSPMIQLMKALMGLIFEDPVEVEAMPSNGLTNLVVKTPRWEPLMQHHRLALAFHNIFHAIGKAQGHIVHVEIVDPDGKPRDHLAHVPAAPGGPVD